ncbi:MAG TPA: biotin/lipoyl-binding protein [Pyrinomonadaceae bacterium]|jgi:HEAT repeat protein|nr:biotin/lipoyl-binding protein [Pyrinomonadaceae bacterium]
MSANRSNGNQHPLQPATVASQKRRRSSWPLITLAALFIIAPFLTWYGTWFGRHLSDAEISEYLSDEKKPRHIQHAFSQIEERMVKGDAGAKRWYPQIVAFASSPVTEFRKTAAYLMGYDNKSEEFHAALIRLLEDAQPGVRRQAALSLVTFGDTRGRGELRAMLEPYTIAASSDGMTGSVVSEGSAVREGTLLARILRDEGSEVVEVRSPLPGRIKSVAAREGARVRTGDALFVLAPDGQFVWEALRALSLIGERDDLPLVERYASGAEAVNEQVKQQATQAARAIQARSEKAGAR